MKYLEYYKKKGFNEDEVFSYFTQCLRDSIKTWDYFVNWDKVFENLRKLKISLSLLNSLIGSKNFKKDFLDLVKEYPEIIISFPVLIAVRENNLKILKDYENLDLSYVEFDFKKIKEVSNETALKYYDFIVKSGLEELFSKVTNFVDYVLGVEVGLDSNGRKNRGGTLMEDVVEVFISKFCEENNLEYLVQADAKIIFEKWNFEVKFDKSSRRYDFAIFSKSKLYLIETNFYNGGGSKLKSVCGEFKSLFNELEEQEIEFIWITDGLGWQSTLRPLEETFKNNNFVFNLKMLEEGILKQVIK